MTSLITSLNNYLVLIDDKKAMFININENKVFIQIEMEGYDIYNELSVSGTNDVIFISSNIVYLLYFNEIQNKLKVTKIMEHDEDDEYDEDYSNYMKIQNDLVIIEIRSVIYFYKLDEIKIKNVSNPIVINETEKEYRIISDKKKFILSIWQNQLKVYKLDDEIKKIAFLKLNERMKCLVSSEKYISMVDESNKNVLTFEIMDQNI
jgi:hypothetical protein